MSDQTPNLTNLGSVDGRNLINVGGGAGLTSINGDATAAQVLSAGAGISIVDGGGGAHTISVTGAITSINGDNTPAQTLASLTSALTVTDGGGGAHSLAIATFAGAGTPGIVNVPVAPLSAKAFFVGADGLIDVPARQFCAGFQASGVAVPDGVITALATGVPLPAGETGIYLIVYSGGVDGVTGQILDVVPRKNGVVMLASGFSGLVETTGQTCNVAGCAVQGLSAGDVIDVAVDHHGGGAATTSTNSKIVAIRIGS